jgi:hypothetical protein
MRHGHLLRAVTIAGLLLGSSLISDASAATTDHALAVSVDDFIYIDTSSEATDQTAAHEKRLRAFMTALRDDVTADRRLSLCRPPAHQIVRPTDRRCAIGCARRHRPARRS